LAVDSLENEIALKDSFIAEFRKIVEH
jgi:hypothetical protein